jgi:glycosyltransferase involved in cell wall biosynthesis
VKILHVIFALNTGGAETMLVDIINEQVRTEKVSLLVINDQMNNLLIAKVDMRVKIILIGRKEKSRNPLFLLKLNLAILKSKCDVIHCHGQSAIRLIVFKKKCVLTVHDVHNPTNYFFLYKRIFAISKAVQLDIEQRSNIRSILVYNGINVDSIKHKKDNSFGTFKIVQVGRLDHKIKGQHIILEALKILVKEKGINDIFIDFIGDGQSLSYLKTIIKDFCLDNYVNFLGNKDREYVYKHLNEYNLLVQPSIHEGFGLSIVEAIAAKVPVLSSNLDGPMEIIEFDKYGSCFEAGNAINCAEMIQLIYQDYPTYQNRANKAYNDCRLKYSIKSTAQNYIKNY